MLKINQLQGFGAAVRPAFGLIVGGHWALDATQKYLWANETVIYSANLGTGRARESAIGNRSFGILGSSGVLDKYTYYTDAMSTSGSLPVSKTYACGCGNADLGIVAGGYVGASNVGTVYKYTYATHATATGTALATSRRDATAQGNSSRGIIAGGLTGTSSMLSSTEKYTYATDARVAATALNYAADIVVSIGDASRGIFSGGRINDNPIASTNLSNEYIYSTDSRVSLTALASTRYSGAGCANHDYGIMAGGYVSSVASASTIKFTFASSANVAGTSLLAATINNFAVSSAPGHY